MSEIKIMENDCHWCESPLTKSHPSLAWVDDYGSTLCEFHPAAFIVETMTRTHEHTPHQSIEEIHRIIREEYHKAKAMRNKEQRIRLVTDDVVSVAKNAQSTSAKAAEKMLPRSGSMRAKVYEAIKFRCQNGLTDHELEEVLKGKHQTVSASRRSLVLDGFIVDSGNTRKNPQGNDCIVWVEKNYRYEAFLFNGAN